MNSFEGLTPGQIHLLRNSVFGLIKPVTVPFNTLDFSIKSGKGKIIIDSLMYNQLNVYKFMSTDLIDINKISILNRHRIGYLNISDILWVLRRRAGLKTKLGRTYIVNLYGAVELWDKFLPTLEYYLTIQRSYISLMRVNIWTEDILPRAFIIKKDKGVPNYQYKCNINFSRKKVIKKWDRLEIQK